MKKEVIFVVLDQYADWESSYLSTALREFGNGEFDIKVASNTLDPVQTIGGFSTLPDYDLSSLPADYEAMFLIGGYSWKSDLAKEWLSTITTAKASEKLLGAICGASEYLGANGLLNDIQHTSNGIESIEGWENSQYSNKAGFIKRQAVLDENVLTANGTGTLEFARMALKALKVASDEQIDGWYGFHKSGFYQE